MLASIVLALALSGDSLLYAVLPLNAGAFGISLAWVGILLSANRIVRLFVYPFLGRLAATDLRQFTIAAAALGALSTLVFSFASGGWALLASRVVWGVAFGALSLSTLAYATASHVGAGRRVGLSLSLRELGPLLSLTFGAAAVSAIGARSTLAAVGTVSTVGIFVAMCLPDLKAEGFEVRPTRLRLPRNAEWLSFFAGFMMDGIFPATVGLLIVQSKEVGEAVIGAGLLLGLKRIAVVVLAPVSGYTADRFGVRRVTAAGFGVAAFGACLIACDAVIAGAVLVSCGAVVTSTGIPMSIATSDVERRIRAFAGVGMARDGGAAAGPFVALLLFDSVGPAWMYSAAGLIFGLVGVGLVSFQGMTVARVT